MINMFSWREDITEYTDQNVQNYNTSYTDSEASFTVTLVAVNICILVNTHEKLLWCGVTPTNYNWLLFHRALGFIRKVSQHDAGTESAEIIYSFKMHLKLTTGKRSS